MSDGFGHEAPFEGATNDWITPKYIIDALGPFDLDPCASASQPWSCAVLSYSPPDRRAGDGVVWKCVVQPAVWAPHQEMGREIGKARNWNCAYLRPSRDPIMAGCYLSYGERHPVSPRASSICPARWDHSQFVVWGPVCPDCLGGRGHGKTDETSWGVLQGGHNLSPLTNGGQCGRLRAFSAGPIEGRLASATWKAC